MKRNPSTENPRRVLFLVGRDALHPGAAGGDLQAWQWAKRMASQGWIVDYVCQSGRGLVERESISGVNIFRLGTGPLLALRAARYYRKHSRAIDFVYEDPIGAGRTPYLSPVYAKVPVLAVWHQVSGLLFTSIHGPVTARAMSSVERGIARFYRRSLLWAPSSERAGEVSVELRIPRERITVLPPTLAAGITIATQVSEPADRFLCLGVFRSYKDFGDVIRAMKLVLETAPSARLVVAGRHGSAEYEQELVELAQSLSIADCVEFRFGLTDAERQNLMRQSLALVLPSLLEGFGIVSIEANAEGTPVVASSGVPTAAVEEGVNGLRYPHGDVPALATALMRLISEPGLRNRMAWASLEHASGLTTDAVGPRFDQLVERAITQKDQTPTEIAGASSADLDQIVNS